MITRRNILAAGGALAAFPASAQAWRPSRPLRLVVPYTRAGSSAVMANLILPHLQAELGQPVQLDFIPGNSGIDGAMTVLGAEPDGHTAMLTASSLITSIEYLFGDRLPFKPQQDFLPVSRLGETALVLACPAERPWQALPELVAAIRARPGTIKAGTGGAGLIGHLAVAAMLEKLGLKDAVEVVHFDGGDRLQAQAMVTGQADMTIAAAASLLPGIREGKIRALATTGKFRAVWTQALEQVPTVVESFPETEMDVADWRAIVARAGTPPAALSFLNQALGKVLEIPAVRQAMVEEGTLPVPDPAPADFAKFLEQDRPMRQRLVELSGARSN